MASVAGGSAGSIGDVVSEKLNAELGALRVSVGDMIGERINVELGVLRAGIENGIGEKLDELRGSIEGQARREASSSMLGKAWSHCRAAEATPNCGTAALQRNAPPRRGCTVSAGTFEAP